MLACLCGGTVKVERIMDFRAAFTGGDPFKTRWRAVCMRCGEGTANIRGFKSKKEAEDNWRASMQMITDLAAEYKVTPQAFIETMNTDKI